MSRKKVFILTNFQQYLKSYSPIIIVQGQIEMLLRAGYAPTLITNRGWSPPEASIFSQVENKQLTPVVIDGDIIDEEFDKDVETLETELLDILEKDSVVITHDLIFLPDYVKLNVACRRIAERMNIHWLHWIHSATNPNDLIKERSMFAGKYAEHLAEKFPDSLICFPNAYDIPRVARNFGYEENEVVEVPHAINPVEGMTQVVQRLYHEKELWKPDVVTIYPLRLDRGKQPEMNVRLMAGLRDCEATSHLIICDFQSTGGDKVTYREDLKRLAEELGVSDRLTFMSEFDESALMDISHQSILELFTLSNVFLLPSKSETYSLIAQEAMSRGNFCILNHDFAPFRQIYGKNAIYKPFSSNIAFDGYNGEIKTDYDSTDGFFRDLASAVLYYLENEKVIRAKTWTRIRRAQDYVFSHYIQPLLTERDTDETEILDNSSSLL